MNLIKTINEKTARSIAYQLPENGRGQLDNFARIPLPIEVLFEVKMCLKQDTH
jgi:hypothetical protein